jgi:FixJ family two-component response regulator
VVNLRKIHPNIPIVVLTGSPERAEEASLAGAQAVMPKPYDTETVAYHIRCAVARHKVRGDYRESESALHRASEKIDLLTNAEQRKT